MHQVGSGGDRDVDVVVVAAGDAVRGGRGGVVDTGTPRTGSEGRISSLKRGCGWDRTRLDGTEGARIWTGQAVLAHNLVKIGTMAG